MQYPTIHLNGTGLEDLIAQQTAVWNAAQALLRALAEAVPNARDYYPQGEFAFSAAHSEYGRQYDSVAQVVQDAERMLIFLQDEKQNRVRFTPAPKLRTGETRDQVIARWEREGRIAVGCEGCASIYAAEDPYSVTAPPHTASKNCESGKRPHCTCDVCF